MILAIWTISAAVLAVTGLFGIREARLDLKALAVGNGIRLVARQRLAAQVLRATIGSLWTLLGLAVWWAGADPALTPSTAILILGNVGITIVALSDVIVGRIVRG